MIACQIDKNFTFEYFFRVTLFFSQITNAKTKQRNKSNNIYFMSQQKILHKLKCPKRFKKFLGSTGDSLRKKAF